MIDVMMKLIGMFAGLIGEMILKGFGFLIIILFVIMMLIVWIQFKYIDYRRRLEREQ
jgi:hypothetical protein